MTGNLVDDPTKVEPANSKPGQGTIANFRIGNSEYVNGEQKSNGFFDIVAFGAQADNVLAHLRKGQRVTVTGRIQHRTFERPDGSKGGRVNLIANAIGISLEFKERTPDQGELVSTDDSPF